MVIVYVYLAIDRACRNIQSGGDRGGAIDTAIALADIAMRSVYIALASVCTAMM
ncbi:MAG: hypothetical protein SVX43_08965 [Cyanobacteriota bacterium]|nr:hypothetical protein [Cyanobacteriota bacterium]